jgi:hypothetical protein
MNVNIFHCFTAEIAESAETRLKSKFKKQNPRRSLRALR